MRVVALVLVSILAFTFLVFVWVVSARAEAIVVTRTVPAGGGTLEYRVGGTLVQSAPIAAGTYRITIESMGGGGGGRGRVGNPLAHGPRRRAQ